MTMAVKRPLIGISPDRENGKLVCAPTYATMIERAGGVPVILAHDESLLNEYLARCDGFVLSGGDDPIMEAWGIPTHPRATRVDPIRQSFELALLRELDARRPAPLLGVCLGMQMMTLARGGAMDQHLPESKPDLAPRHWGKVPHEVAGDLGWGALEGIVESHHRQVMTDPGSLVIAATSPDGLIEAVRDPARPFYLGVQWHPERTQDETLGLDLFRRLIEACSVTT